MDRASVAGRSGKADRPPGTGRGRLTCIARRLPFECTDPDLSDPGMTSVFAQRRYKEASSDDSNVTALLNGIAECDCSRASLPGHGRVFMPLLRVGGRAPWRLRDRAKMRRQNGHRAGQRGAIRTTTSKKGGTQIIFAFLTRERVRSQRSCLDRAYECHGNEMRVR